MSPGTGERGDHTKESSQRGSAQRCRSRDQFAIDAGERGGEGLHRERQTIEDGADHQAAEGEGQSVAGERDPPAAQRTVRSERDQHIESQHGRRKNDGQRDDGLDQELPAPAGEGNPVGDGQAEDQQDGGDGDRQLQRQPECLPVDCHGSRFVLCARAQTHPLQPAGCRRYSPLLLRQCEAVLLKQTRPLLWF